MSQAAIKPLAHRDVLLPLLGGMIVLAWLALYAWARSPYARYLDHSDLAAICTVEGASRAALYVVSAIALVATYVLCRYIVTSRLGRVLTAVRDAELKTRFCGYESTHYKLFVWTLSAMLCGLAGALYVPQVGIINPSEMSPANSVEIAIAVALGGRGTLLGPILGAALLHGAKSVLTVAVPELWLFVLGLAFIVVTRWLPRGVLGLFWREGRR
jgi:urea transport system permease protein